MNVAEFTLVVWAASLLAGLVGSLTGRGGGVIITPLLPLALGVDFRYGVVGCMAPLLVEEGPGWWMGRQTTPTPP